MHYALHHTQLPAYLREQKRYHLAHHYKNFELGFGVTSAYPFIHSYLSFPRTARLPTDHTGKIWDVVFNTVLLT
jgi:sterol desaturase/sphingolipid hydroxylase (fatty acid hydroxylase superfamily)